MFIYVLHIGAMEAAVIDSGPLDAATLRAVPSLPAGNALQSDPHSRRICSQCATWRTALLVAVCTALILLVVRCTMRLSNRTGATVRMLAEGGGDWNEGESQPLLAPVRPITHSRCSSAFFDRVDLTCRAVHCICGIHLRAWKKGGLPASQGPQCDTVVDNSANPHAGGLPGVHNLQKRDTEQLKMITRRVEILL